MIDVSKQLISDSDLVVTDDSLTQVDDNIYSFNYVDLSPVSSAVAAKRWGAITFLFLMNIHVTQRECLQHLNLTEKEQKQH